MTRERCETCGMWKHIPGDPVSWKCPNCGSTTYRYTWAMMGDDDPYHGFSDFQMNIVAATWQIRNSFFGAEQRQMEHDQEEDDREELCRVRQGIPYDEYYEKKYFEDGW